MSLDSTTSSSTTDPLGRSPSTATTPDVDALAQTTTTTPSTAPTTPPASPPPPQSEEGERPATPELPYCTSPQPASAAELPAETDYPPARVEDDNSDNANGPKTDEPAAAGSSSKEKRKGGGEGAEGEQVRDKRVRKTRHKRRPSSQHRYVSFNVL